MLNTVHNSVFNTCTVIHQMYGCNLAVRKVTNTQNPVLIRLSRSLFATTIFK